MGSPICRLPSLSLFRLMARRRRRRKGPCALTLAASKLRDDRKGFDKEHAVANPTFETILYDVADGIATVTLNRPERLNAFTGHMMAEMIAAFDLSDDDDDVRAVIVTGAGRGFCAGADLSAGGSTFDRSGPQDPTREEGRVGDVLRDGGGRLTL